tara:strand:+ start:322 stop:531 length:210 start_codon:yes stop_codon:yes gene_type:complete
MDKKPQSMYWSGGGVVKSQKNDFNWRKSPSLCSFGRIDQNQTTESEKSNTGRAVKKNVKKIAAIEKAKV